MRGGCSPFFRIAGTKTKESLSDARKVLAVLCSQGRRLIEPFCGSGSVSMSFSPPEVVLNDAQPNVIYTLYSAKRYPVMLFKAFDELRSRFLENPTEDHYKSIRDNYPSDLVSRAAWFIFVTHAGFNWLWRVNRQGRNNVAFGKEYAIRRLERAMNEKAFFKTARWLSSEGVTLTIGSYLEAIDGAVSGDVLYVDPPYYKKFSRYTAEGFCERDHKRLAEELKRAWYRGVICILQCNGHQDILDFYRDFCRVFCRKIRRKVQGKGYSDFDYNDTEFIVVSQSQHRELFVDHRFEEVLKCHEIIELKAANPHLPGAQLGDISEPKLREKKKPEDNLCSP